MNESCMAIEFELIDPGEYQSGRVPEKDLGMSLSRSPSPRPSPQGERETSSVVKVVWLRRIAVALVFGMLTNGQFAPALGEELKLPMMVLVAESGNSHADDAAIKLINSPAIRAKKGEMATEVLDLAVSRNRAAAARYHVVKTPLLLCLSSGGVIISRDEKGITKKLVLKRIEEAERQGPEMDAKLAGLQEAADNEKGCAVAQFRLADFLVSHQNAFEAIPVLGKIAHTATNPPIVRVRAWVTLAREHLWIAEVEKARHEADDLMAALGAVTPEANAGGNLIHGLQDAKGKRVALARKEFDEAIAAAPESVYGKEASAELAKLK